MNPFRKLICRGIRSRVLENADPKKWREHLFGLTPERWKYLKGKSFWITGAGTGYGAFHAPFQQQAQGLTGHAFKNFYWTLLSIFDNYLINALEKIRGEV